MDFFKTMPLRQEITSASLQDETTAMNHLLKQLNWSQDLAAKAYDYGKGLAQYIRGNLRKNPMDAFMEEYSLSDEEGVLLMCLAEAMMRIPDKATQDAFISDVISQGHWAKHIDKENPFLVNAGSWGLLLTGKIVDIDKSKQQKLRSWLKTCSNPFIRQGVRQAMKFMGQKYVLGQTIEKAFKAAETMTKKGYRYSFDMLGEGARSMGDAKRYLEAYKAAIHKIGKQCNGGDIMQNHGISIKLSALYPRYELMNYKNSLSYLGDVLEELCLMAKSYNIGLNVDAEEVGRLDLSLELFARILHDERFAGWDGFGVVVQAYQKQAPLVIDHLYQLARDNQRRFMLRLVKGAYWDSEIKHYQQMGTKGYPVWTKKINSDAAYIYCAQKLFEYGDVIFPQFATHNAASVGAVLAVADQYPDVAYEFQRLHGMGEELHEAIVEHIHQVPSRIYAPVGPYEDLLSYLVRRLLENGANSSFVNHIGNEDISLDVLLEDSVNVVRANKHHHHDKIPLPPHIYGDHRLNAKGLNLDDFTQLSSIKDSLKQSLNMKALSLLHRSVSATEKPVEVHAPFDPNLYLGTQQSVDIEHIDAAIEDAQKAQSHWSNQPAQYRANLLRRLADDLEENMHDYMRICILEAGKTYSDAVAEVREAIDFCRFYAGEAEKMNKGQQGTGVWVCISPWNFPLAIFLGQITAALAAGNTVIAKPAEQTSLIAYYTVRRMHQLGFPTDVIQLVIGKGSIIGDALTKSPSLAGVCFTGSTATAKIIQNNITQSESKAVLIAETGGQNVMIVDSTALAEQVTDDVMSSSFQSAGQRCSALRVLCVQEDVADTMINLIIGGLKERKIGSPLKMNCDVAPVIDHRAMGNLNNYIQEKQSEFKLLYQLPKNEEVLDGACFVLPTIFEIQNLDQMGEEQFGPILHILRYKRQDLPKLLKQVNDLGYGLTAGLHSRIKQRWSTVFDTLNVGNIYINRNQIGAIVGSQPFGGEGLSGTGPKAGGPNYLPRFTQMPCFDFVDKDYGHETVVNQWEANPQGWDFEKRQTVLSLWQSQTTLLSLDSAEETMVKKLLEQLITDSPIKLYQQIRLPGTTGEENYLQVSPKEKSCINFSTPKLSDLLGIMIAIAMGHHVYTKKSLPESWIKFLYAGHQSLLPLSLDQGGIAFDVYLSDEDQMVNTLQQANTQSGAIAQIVPVKALIAETNQNQVIWNKDLLMRFCKEKTLSIDTSRTGGNVELLSLC